MTRAGPSTARPQPFLNQHLFCKIPRCSITDKWDTWIRFHFYFLTRILTIDTKPSYFLAEKFDSFNCWPTKWNTFPKLKNWPFWKVTTSIGNLTGKYLEFSLVEVCRKIYFCAREMEKGRRSSFRKRRKLWVRLADELVRWTTEIYLCNNSMQGIYCLTAWYLKWQNKKINLQVETPLKLMNASWADAGLVVQM